MGDEYPRRALSQTDRAGLLIVCAVSILCLSQAILAQSGRRPPKREPPPPSAPSEPVGPPEHKTPAEKPPPAAYLIVGGDRYSASINILPSYVDEAVDSCVKHLRKSPSLDVKAGGTMTRMDAIERAKREKEAHVVWLEVRVEGDRTDGVSVGYTVFEPQTARVKNFGRVYLGSRRAGNGRVGVGVPSVIKRYPLDHYLREAGEDVADRVMDVFQVPPPRR
ncbi:MAG TPA: hypothetical protein VE262_15950 [Blastocatellia bacterium]|nr:hypothetical protein [Blastocatellia bacterium]